ncbi:MAG: hypothetical protein A2Y38_26210 [Spirochaetes bacterium GWB1_59_5]|nr:MAG: hypothetical protein A2Y38_26210 [Spirochaetes bacterium GWB1_59_5]
MRNYSQSTDPSIPARGLGDTVAHLLHATGADKLAEAYTHLTGRPCNCGARQDALNKLVPYKDKT